MRYPHTLPDQPKRLLQRPGGQGVAGSNPVSPTGEWPFTQVGGHFFFVSELIPGQGGPGFSQNGLMRDG